jgi:hypothetical protein
MGYEIKYDKNHQAIINEKRPWLIGYLPDEFKDELNSEALFSDLAHDLCKWNAAYTSFALENATSIFILGYSMPEEDKWIWARFKNIDKKEDRKIYVASKGDSDNIVERLKNIDFAKAEKVNSGCIN